MEQYWKFVKSQRAYKDNVLEIERKQYLFKKINSSMLFTVINTKDWVMIIPKLDNGNFLMVKQYRVATSEVTLEFPGGAINQEEDKFEGALRELREETGLYTENIRFLATVKPNPAILSNSCHIFFADKCNFKFSTDFDDFEDIELVEISQKKLEKYIKNGKIVHSLVLTAYSLYMLNYME